MADDDKDAPRGKTALLEPNGKATAKLGLGTTTAFDLVALSKALPEHAEVPEPVLTVIAGMQTGLLVPLGNLPVTLGRGVECDVVLTGRGISRQHFRIEAGEQSMVPVIIDLDSTNGVFIDGVSVRRRALSPGDRIQIGPNTTLKFSYEERNEIGIRQRKYEEAIRDDLTGLYNRRHFDGALEQEIAYARRHGEELSVLLIDLDYFKQINDQFGHPVGDLILRRVSAHFSEHLRSEDLLARYGGEEFAVALRGQDAAGAYETAERLRNRLAARRFNTGDRELKVTASIGIATLDRSAPQAAHELMAAADRMLYRAKDGGRDRSAGTACEESTVTTRD